MNEIIEKIAAEWWKYTAFAALFIVIWVLLSVLLYKQFFKRFYDIVLSGCALLILSPLLVLLTTQYLSAIPYILKSGCRS